MWPRELPLLRPWGPGGQHPPLRCARWDWLKKAGAASAPWHSPFRTYGYAARRTAWKIGSWRPPPPRSHRCQAGSGRPQTGATDRTLWPSTWTEPPDSTTWRCRSRGDANIPCPCQNHNGGQSSPPVHSRPLQEPRCDHGAPTPPHKPHCLGSAGHAAQIWPVDPRTVEVLSGPAPCPCHAHSHCQLKASPCRRVRRGRTALATPPQGRCRPQSPPSRPIELARRPCRSSSVSASRVRRIPPRPARRRPARASSCYSRSRGAAGQPRP
mmetsp:Transcript_91952/g.187194  ORF Transcript_91952/g.187194 Transcript_91952/m.187194 type:complete len:268 (-) Transcript_91952:854-1657(-)